MWSQRLPLFFLGYQQFFPTYAIIRLEQNYARPQISDMFSFYFSLFFFHLTVDSHPIPTQLVESFLSYISLLYARTRKLNTGMKRNL
jgi:hypothetical protein